MLADFFPVSPCSIYSYFATLHKTLLSLELSVLEWFLSFGGLCVLLDSINDLCFWGGHFFSLYTWPTLTEAVSLTNSGVLTVSQLLFRSDKRCTQEVKNARSPLAQISLLYFYLIQKTVNPRNLVFKIVFGNKKFSCFSYLFVFKKMRKRCVWNPLQLLLKVNYFTYLSCDLFQYLEE